jgi:Tol biopolymer transport system component/predicted Ser/Thr protein kinase
MVGRTVANYKIVGELGTGGMGVVYKAQDIRLERFLALKFLKKERVNEDFRRRFLQEARASSALAHPSIIHIYDIGVFEGMDYIAMEFVEGYSLRDVLRERRLPVNEVVKFAIQIADAMSAAHAAGIVHRDLKPGNLMVTPGRLIKILDFGLAKLGSPGTVTQTSASMESTNSVTTLTADHTQFGIALGSPAYMSPEQATGKAVDGRSDIFALGAILYEMIAGQRPFTGETTIEVISAVLRHTPPVPSASNSEAGPELDAVVMRCLDKDPGQRFQAMEEVKRALEALRTSGTTTGISIRIPVEPVRKPRGWMAAGWVAAGIIALGAGLYFATRPRGATDTIREAAEPERLTLDLGLNMDPAISLDGKFVAFASDRSGEGNLDIWVKQVGGGDPIRLTRNPADEHEPSFSPDGTHVAYRSAREGGGLYLTSTLGGEERKLTGEGRRPRFSPDGKRIVFWKGLEEPFPLRAGGGNSYVLDLATSESRQIAPDFAAAVHPLWSPDGKHILFLGLKEKAGLDWWIVPAEGGPAARCHVNVDGVLMDPFDWRGDFIYYEIGAGTPGAKIGRQRIDPSNWRPVGAPTRITMHADVSPSVSLDGHLAFAGLVRNTNLYSLPLNVNRGKTSGAPQSLTKDSGENLARSLSADGQRVVFTADRGENGGGRPEVWGKDLSTGREHAITNGGQYKTLSEITADGSRVAWREAKTSVRDIFVSPFDGGAAVKLCGDCTGQTVWSPDGSFALVRESSSPGGIALVDTATSTQRTWLREPGVFLQARAISSDGKWLAFTAGPNQTDYSIYVARFSAEKPPRSAEWVKLLTAAEAHPFPRWSPDGNLLYFGSRADGFNCLWALKLNPRTKQPDGRPFAVQHFHQPTLKLEAPSISYPLALGADRAVLSLTERSGSIWLLNPEH